MKNKKKEEDLRIAFFSIVLRVKTGKNREEIREMRNKKRGNPRFRGSLSCLEDAGSKEITGTNSIRKDSSARNILKEANLLDIIIQYVTVRQQ